MATVAALRTFSLWAGLPIELRDALDLHGIVTASDLYELFDGSMETAEEVVQELSPGASFSAELIQLYNACKGSHFRNVTRIGSFTDAEVAAVAVERARHLERVRLHLDPSDDLCSGQVVPIAKAKPAKWPAKRT